MSTKKEQNGQGGHGSILVREYEAKDRQPVIQIYSVGILELVVDTAFRGLKYHPESLLLYILFTVACFMVTKSWWMLGLVPALVLCARYYCSWLLINDFLQYMLSTDLSDIEEYYINSPDRCLWVAAKEGKVVGLVAAIGDRTTGSLELLRMSVDPDCRKCGLGKALSRKVIEYAASQNYSSVKLGTTAYSEAAHRLYERVGFRMVGTRNGYKFSGTIHHNIFFKIFYRVRQYRYRLDIPNQGQVVANGDDTKARPE